MSWNDAPEYTPQIGLLHVAIAVLAIAALVWWGRGEDVLRALDLH